MLGVDRPRRGGWEGSRPGPARADSKEGCEAERGEQGTWAEEGRQGQGPCQEGLWAPGLYPRLEGASVGSVSLRLLLPLGPQRRARTKADGATGSRICISGDARGALPWGRHLGDIQLPRSQAGLVVTSPCTWR